MNLSKVNGLMESVKRELREAAEVEISDLPKDKQAAVRTIEQRMAAKATNFWDGISGVIVMFSIHRGAGGGAGRLTKADLEHLMKVPSLRWVECEPKELMVGM